MKKQETYKAVILWTARITGSLIVAFLLFFLLAHAFGNDESGEGFRSVSEFITFLFFPISVVIGLILALKWELIGGLLTVIGMGALLFMRVDLIDDFQMWIPLIPGILYLLYGLKYRSEII